MCPSPFAFLGRKTVATKQTSKRNAAGRFEARTEGAKVARAAKKASGAKREMQKKVTDAWPDITDVLVETAKKGDFRATKWLWDESGLGQEMPKRGRGSKSGFAQTLIDKFNQKQAAARQQTAATQPAATSQQAGAVEEMEPAQ